MARFIDARIPVVFDTAPTAADAVLAPGPTGVPAHPAGCACCAARSPAALALDQLFLDRVRGAVPWFGRVVVLAPEAEAVRAALTEDAVVSARFCAA